jgi:hypothetical protein
MKYRYLHALTALLNFAFFNPIFSTTAPLPRLYQDGYSEKSFPYGDGFEIKMLSFCYGRILVLDCVSKNDCSRDPFTNVIKRAMCSISKSCIGYKLLRDLTLFRKSERHNPFMTDCNNPYVIVFPLDFANRLASALNINPQQIKQYEKNNAIKCLPPAIKSIFPQNDGFDELLKPSGSCVVHASKKWSIPTVFIDMDVMSCSCIPYRKIYKNSSSVPKIQDKKIELISKAIPLHQTLFHELNHVRHFFQGVKTIQITPEQTLVRSSNANGNGSSLNSQIYDSNDELVITKMENAEEELQLTGFTIMRVSDSNKPDFLQEKYGTT